MRKKILSVIVAAAVAGVAVVAMPMVSASAANQGIWFNPTDPDASGDVVRDTNLYAQPNEVSNVLKVLPKGTLLDDEGRTTDSEGTEWIKVKVHHSSDNVFGYVKASDFQIFYY